MRELGLRPGAAHSLRVEPGSPQEEGAAAVAPAAGRNARSRGGRWGLTYSDC